MDAPRSLLSIIAVYILSVAGVMIYLALRASPPGANGPIDPYSAEMVDILKVVVLPVVTFMLGFYFGTGANVMRSTTHRPS